MQRPLRFLLVSAFTTALWCGADAQNVGINVTGAAPDAKAILDVNVGGLPAGGKKGLLIPRMTYAQRLNIAGLNATHTGLWVYQTDDGTDIDPTIVPAKKHGYFYWDGAAWQRWSPNFRGWRLNGNAAGLTDYVGTQAATNDDLHIRTTSNIAGVPEPQIRINGGAVNPGFVGVNLGVAPTERLEINGGLKVGNTTLNTQGAIKYDPAAVTPNRWHFGNVDNTVNGWQRLENAERLYPNQAYRPVQDQCLGATGVKIKGTWNGTTVPGNANTPFATNTGSNNRRGQRVQYIYPESELLAAGLCYGPITRISFYAISNDGPVGCTPTVNCADIRIDLRMGTTALNNFGPAVASSAVPLTVDWDAAVEASANVHVNSANPTLIQTGWVDLTLTGAGFNWLGGNLCIDISWVRAAANGLSPPVQLETGLAYTATKWMQVTLNADANHGNAYNDNVAGSMQILGVNTANAAQGTTQNRPVTRFYGRVQSQGYANADVIDDFIGYDGGMFIDTLGGSVATADALFRGPGSVRARTAVYDGSLQLSDHVFDKYFDGDVKPEDTEAHQGFAYVGVKDLKEYIRKERHLPNMPSRTEWESHGTPSIGQLQTGLWETVESQALNIIELEKDLRALESLAFGGSSDPAAIERMINEVNASKRLSEAQKLELTDALRQRMNARTKDQ